MKRLFELLFPSCIISIVILFCFCVLIKPYYADATLVQLQLLMGIFLILGGISAYRIIKK